MKLIKAEGASSSIIETAMLTANISQTEMSISTPNEFQYESIRLFSLISWINKHVSKEKLARYGFYYNLESDYVQCYSCEVVIGEWGVGDDPLIEHHKHSPDCNFINLRDSNNVPAKDEHELEVELKTFKDSINNGRRNNVKYLIPRHPDFKAESARLKSYTDWPKSIKQTPEELSSAGFFYLGVGDEVKCFFCGGCLKDWEVTDSACDEHKKFFFNDCSFIKKNYQDLKRKNSKHQTKTLVKATPLQILTLTDYMNSNPDLKDSKINLGSSKELYNKLWKEITETLNILDGPKKQVKAWKEVWRNHKYNKKRKSTPPSTPQVDRSNQDYEVPNKKLQIYNTNEDSNISFNNVTNQMVLYNNNSQSQSVTVDQCYSSPPLSNNNRNLEFELQKQKCENERLQLELDRMKFEMEKREMQEQLQNDKSELEKKRLEMEHERNFLPSYLLL